MPHPHGRLTLDFPVIAELVRSIDLLYYLMDRLCDDFFVIHSIPPIMTEPIFDETLFEASKQLYVFHARND